MHISIEAANFPTSQEYWKDANKKIEFLPIQMYFYVINTRLSFTLSDNYLSFIQVFDHIYIAKHIDYAVMRVDHTESR